MSDALRTVFAEFGFDIDAEKLEKLEASLRKIIGAENAVAAASAAAAKAETKAAEDVAKAAEKEAARKAALLDVGAARTRAAEAAQQAQTDHAGQSQFDASDEGKKYAAWKRLTEREAAAKAPVTSLIGALDKLQQKTSASIGQKLPASFQKLAQSIGVADGDFVAMGQIATGAAGVAVHAIVRITTALFSFSTAFAAASEQLRDTAADAGVTTSELQSMSYAGVQSGVGAERLTRAMSSLHQQMQEARLHGGGINSTLRRLGVESRTAGRGIRSASDVMNDLSLVMNRIQNPLRRDRIGVRVYGQEWYRLREVMHAGEGGLIDLRSQMEALGGGVLPEAVEASRGFTRSTGRLGVAMDSLRSVLAVGILPVFTRVIEKAALMAGWWSRMTRGTQVVQVGLLALGATAAAVALGILVAFGPLLLPFIKIAAVVAIAWLVLDDLFVLMKGGNSVIGTLIDSIFGVGASLKVVHALKEAWEDIVEVVSRAIEEVVRFTALRESLPVVLGGRGRAAGAAAAFQRTGNSGGATGTGAVRSSMSPAAVASLTRSAALVPFPVWRPVTAPAGGRASGVVRQIANTNHNVFQLAGPDAHQLAGEVGRLLERQAREQRDADHPVDGDDEGEG